ncbi:hypothetical protein R70199_07161 [Paraburkholderia domus]|nr:hypothetical protein R70199_07161 [Paraburkholderia domus]
MCFVDSYGPFSDCGLNCGTFCNSVKLVVIFFSDMSHCAIAARIVGRA